MGTELAGIIETRLCIPVSTAPFFLFIAKRPCVTLTDINNLWRTVFRVFTLSDGGLVADTTVSSTFFLLCIVRVVGTLDTEIKTLGNKVELEFVLKVEVYNILTLNSITVLVDKTETIGANCANEIRVGNYTTSLTIKTVA